MANDSIKMLEQAGVKVVSSTRAGAGAAPIQKDHDRGQVTFDSVDGWYPIFQYWQQGFVGERIPQRALELIRQYRTWIYACVNRRSNAVAAIPLRLYCRKRSPRTRILFQHRTCNRWTRKWLDSNEGLLKYTSQHDEIVEILDHQILDMLRTSVQPGWTYFNRIHLTNTYLDLCGMAFWAFGNYSSGIPHAFQVLPSQYTWPHWSRKGEVYEYVFGFMPNTTVWQPEEVLFFKLASPIHQILGYGGGHAAYGGVMIQNSIENYTDRSFQNGIFGSGILSPEESLSEDQAKRLATEFNRKYAGAMNSGKLILAPFKVKFEAYRAADRLFDTLAKRATSKEEIAAAYHVPLTFLEVSKADASAVQDNITFRRDGIYPRCLELEGFFNGPLTDMYDEDLFLAFDNPVPADREYQLRRATAMNQTDKAVEINELRQALDLEPDPQFDGQLVERAAAANPFAGGSEAHDEPQAPEAQGTRAVKAAVKTTPKEQSFALILRGLFAEQRKAFLEKILTVHSPIRSPQSAILKLPDAWDQDAWTQRFMDETRESLERDILAGAESGAQKIGMQIAFDIARPEVQEFIQNYSMRFSQAVNETTYSAIKNALSSGLDTGSTYNEIADKINGVFDNAETVRSQMIAQTEGARALNAGNLEAWKMSGQVQGAYWDADPEACEFCKALAALYGPEDGKMIPLGDNFLPLNGVLLGVGGGTMVNTYSDVPHPPLHPRCICTLAPQLIGGKILWTYHRAA
jgi:HK97 family phage portal protein